MVVLKNQCVVELSEANSYARLSHSKQLLQRVKACIFHSWSPVSVVWCLTNRTGMSTVELIATVGSVKLW